MKVTKCNSFILTLFNMFWPYLGDFWGFSKYLEPTVCQLTWSRFPSVIIFGHDWYKRSISCPWFCFSSPSYDENGKVSQVPQTLECRYTEILKKYTLKKSSKWLDCFYTPTMHWISFHLFGKKMHFFTDLRFAVPQCSNKQDSFGNK